MIAFICLLINELKADIPHWGIIRVEPKNSDLDCSSYYDSLEKYKKKCSNYPKEFGGPDECNRVMKPYAGYKCFFEDGESAVNKILSQVDSSLELIILDSAIPGQKIDFNKLPSQMVVILEHSNYETSKILSIPDLMLKAKFDGNLKGYKQLSKELSKIQPKETDIVRIVGNISEKVSTLVLTLQTIQIVDNDLNTDTFILSTGTLDENSPYKISSNTFLSEISQSIPKPDKLNVKRKGCYYYDKSTANITISFETGYTPDEPPQEYPVICLYVNRTYESSFYTVKLDYNQFVDLVTNGKEVTFKYNENFAKLFEGDDKFKLNLTIADFQPERDPSYQLEYKGSWYNSQLLAKEEVEMNYEGDWSIFKNKNKFELNLNYDKNLYEIDTSALEKIATVTKTDAFQFKSNWSEKKDKKNIGLIVGVTVACVVVVAVIVVVVVIVVKKKQKVQSSRENS